MSVCQSRIKTEKLIDSSKAGCSANISGMTTPSSISDLEPAGLTDLLPSSFTQFSNFKDIMNIAATGINTIYRDFNKAFKLPSLGDFDLMMQNPGGLFNFNSNPINKTLGIFHSILCGDSNGIDLNLRALFLALEYDFGLLNWNICGRQQMRNPVDVFINSMDNLRRDYNAFANMGPRMLQNLQRGVRGFVRRLNLPDSLEACMLDNALLNMSIKNAKGISPGAIRNLRKALNPDICKKSQEGVPGYSRTMEKTKIAPLVTGLSRYNEETMYAFQGAILASGQVPNDIVMEVLCDSIEDKDSDNLLNTLQLIAFTKLTAVVNKNKWNGDVNNLTENLHKVDNAGEDILSAILTSSEAGQMVNPLDVIKVDRNYSADMEIATDVKASNVLAHMKDNLVETTSNAEKRFYDAVKLIQIADPKFKPAESVIDMSECESLANLAIAGGEDSIFKSNKKGPDPEFTTVNHPTHGQVRYRKVYNDISLMDQVIGCA